MAPSRSASCPDNAFWSKGKQPSGSEEEEGAEEHDDEVEVEIALPGDEVDGSGSETTGEVEHTFEKIVEDDTDDGAIEERLLPPAR
jgi:hypothetical protein